MKLFIKISSIVLVWFVISCHFVDATVHSTGEGEEAGIHIPSVEPTIRRQIPYGSSRLLQVNSNTDDVTPATEAPATIATLSPATVKLSFAPVYAPTAQPTFVPSVFPTGIPSFNPTLSQQPSYSPSSAPSSSPSEIPSSAPSSSPSEIPSSAPSSSPSEIPSSAPSSSPSEIPSLVPVCTPTQLPITAHTDDLQTSLQPMTPFVSSNPNTVILTLNPTAKPTVNPNAMGFFTTDPVLKPTSLPVTTTPTASPTTQSSASSITPSTIRPSFSPSVSPSASSLPSFASTNTPTQSLSTDDTLAPVPQSPPNYSWSPNTILGTFAPSLAPITNSPTSIANDVNPSSSRATSQSQITIAAAASIGAATLCFALICFAMYTRKNKKEKKDKEERRMKDLEQQGYFVESRSVSNATASNNTPSFSWLSAPYLYTYFTNRKSSASTDDMTDKMDKSLLFSEANPYSRKQIQSSNDSTLEYISRRGSNGGGGHHRDRGGGGGGRHKFERSLGVSNDSSHSTDSYNSSLTSPVVTPSIDWNDLYVYASAPEEVVLGKGAFGTVIRAVWRPKRKQMDGSDSPYWPKQYEVAVKVITKALVEGVGMNNKFFDKICHRACREVQLIMNAEEKMNNQECITHAYGIAIGAPPISILKLFRMSQADKCIGIVLRFEGGGSLGSLIHPSSPPPTAANGATPAAAAAAANQLPMSEKLRILSEIAKGLANLHAQGIIHADIKPENILLSEHTPPRVRLADFGMSVLKRELEKDNGRNGGGNDSSMSMTNQTRGTPIYCAPEMLVDPYKEDCIHFKVAKPSRKTDMYAFGLLAWQVLSQQKPFRDIHSEGHLCATVHLNNRPDLNLLPTDTPPAVTAMITSCWSKQREDRYSAAKCFSILNSCMEIYFSNFDIFLSHNSSTDTMDNALSVGNSHCPVELLNNIVYLFNYAELRVRWNRNGLLLSSSIKEEKEEEHKTSSTEMTWGISEGSTSSASSYGQLEEEKKMEIETKNLLQQQQNIYDCVVFVACIDSCYQSSLSCMTELRQAQHLIPAIPIVLLVLEPNLHSWASPELLKLYGDVTLESTSGDSDAHTTDSATAILQSPVATSAAVVKFIDISSIVTELNRLDASGEENKEQEEVTKEVNEKKKKKKKKNDGGGGQQRPEEEECYADMVRKLYLALGDVIQIADDEQLKKQQQKQVPE